MKNYILVTEKKWHEALFEKLKVADKDENWYLISSKESFSVDIITSLKPDRIFIPHWSSIIPESIFLDYECIVFHMTDLPFGRGGSPLQNLIVEGLSETKLSAIRVTKGIDEGPVYIKKNLLLFGTAEEIFLRASEVIYKMIKEINLGNIVPSPQHGEVKLFKRRKPSDSNIAGLNSINQIYDYIRMLDADGYPNAFVEFNDFKIEFSRAQLKSNGLIIADARISKK